MHIGSDTKGMANMSLFMKCREKLHAPPGYPNSKRQTPEITRSDSNPSGSPILETVPEHIGVNLAVNLAIHVDDIHVALRRVANYCTIEDAGVCVLRNVDAQRAVNLKFQPGV